MKLKEWDGIEWYRIEWKGFDGLKLNIWDMKKDNSQRSNAEPT